MSSILKNLHPFLAAATIGLATITSSPGDTVTWNFGTTSGSASPSSSAVTNLTVGDVTQGNNNGTTTMLANSSTSSGYTGSSGTYNAGAAARTGVLATAASGSAYFEFSLTPAAGFQVALTGIAFGTRSTSTGPQAYTLRSSLDSYTSDLATGSIANTSTWTLKTNTGLTSTTSAATTYRIYGYNGTGSASAGTANWRIDDLALTVTVSASSSDTTPPTLATVSPLSPADNATGVSIATSLSATFSESIAAGTGAITLYKASDNSIVQSFTVGTPAVTLSGATATFTPSSALLNNTDYYVLIPSGVIVDGASNPFAGISAPTSWNFKTVPADIVAPTILSVTPTTGSTDIAPPTSLTVTFSENVQVASSGSPKILVKKVSDDSTVAEIDATLFGPVSVSGAVATIPLSPALDYGASYYVTIDAGAFEDVSTSNNPFAGLTKFLPSTSTLSWSFSTVNVPSLTTSYSQTFATYTSAATLPSGWSASGGAGFSSIYLGDWGTTPAVSSPGGFTGNASVFGYQHNSLTNTSLTPLLQTLTLRNTTGATLTDLSIAYKGRVTVTANSRIPVFSVSVAGSPQAALAYSTADGDNSQRNASVTGLSIADGATFQITWSSSYPTGAGSARQIGISDVSISVGSSLYAPTVASLAVPTASIGGTVAIPQAEVLSDGGQVLSARGFVYAMTTDNANPTLGAALTTTVTDSGTTAGGYSATLSGLTSGTSYSIRAYATNATGVSYSAAISFTTLATPPSLTGAYTQGFGSFNSSLVLPPGWTAISSGGIQNYGADWSSSVSNGGFAGNEPTPGVLGYRHTSSSGNLVVTLRLINATGNTLNSLFVKYLGRTADITQTRTPTWTVAVNGTAVSALQYATDSPDQTVKSTVVTGLSIAPGAEFSITWTSDRGNNASGSSKKIGLSSVEVAVPTAPVLASASATSVTTSTATLNGSVTSDGYLGLTSRGFVYAPTSVNPDPLIGGVGVIQEVDAAVTIGALSKALGGLSASTGYSLKAYATNSLGTTYSSVATFTTLAPPVGYEAWNDNLANQSADQDFDGDGLDNGTEYFMGTAGNAFTPNPGIIAGAVTWPRAAGTTISSFKVEVSTNLSTWEDATVHYSSNLSITGSSVSFTLPAATAGPFFVRLNVTP